MTTTSKPAMAPDRPTVLIVEDDLGLGALLLDALRTQGIGGDLVRSGEAALTMAAGLDYSAVVIDQELPGMSGLEVCRRLRRGGLGAPVMMMSARDEVGADFRPAGADACLVKPFLPDELGAVLRALPERSSLAPGAWSHETPRRGSRPGWGWRRWGYRAEATGAAAS